MSAEPQYTESETGNDAPSALHLSAVREHRRLRVVGDAEVVDESKDSRAAVRPARRRLRKPLSLVPQASRRRGVPAVLGVVLTVVVALGVVLLVNIRISSTQYDLVQLRQEQQSLQEQNQGIREEVEFQQAPQNLADRASQLGMVPASQQVQLDLRNGSTDGTPAPAQELTGKAKEQAAKEGRTNLIGPPLDSDTQAAKQAAQREEDRKKKETSAEKGSDKASASPSASGGR